MWLCSDPRCSLVAGPGAWLRSSLRVPAVTDRGRMGRSACGQRDQSEARSRWVTGLTLVKCGRAKSVVTVDVPAVGEPSVDVQAGR
jgi:hypothetical protein